MTGFVWAATLDAAMWIVDEVEMTSHTVAGFDLISSMHPLNLVTLFIPGFFGVLDGHHTWGAGLMLSNMQSG